MDRSIIRDIGTSSDSNGFEAALYGYVIKGEVRIRKLYVFQLLHKICSVFQFQKTIY